MKKHNEHVLGKDEEWLLGIKGSVFHIIYDKMISERKKPFGKDEAEFFSRAEKMRDVINKNPEVKLLHKHVLNSYEDE